MKIKIFKTFQPINNKNIQHTAKSTKHIPITGVILLVLHLHLNIIEIWMITVCKQICWGGEDNTRKANNTAVITPINLHVDKYLKKK